MHPTTTTPEILERIDATGTVAEWWKAIGGTPEYPAATETALAILRGQGFQVDEPLLLYLQKTGQFSAPDYWTAEDVLLLAGLAHAKRLWAPGSDLWKANCTRWEQARQWAKSEGRMEAGRESLCAWSYRDLALLLLKTDDTETRERIFSHIETKLELERLQ